MKPEETTPSTWLSPSRRDRVIRRVGAGLALVATAHWVDGDVLTDRAAFLGGTGVTLLSAAGVTAWAERRARQKLRRTGVVDPEPCWVDPNRERAVGGWWTWALLFWVAAGWYPADRDWVGGFGMAAMASAAVAMVLRGREGRDRRRRDRAEADAAARGWLTAAGFERHLGDLAARVARAGAARSDLRDRHYRLSEAAERLTKAGVKDGRVTDLERRQQGLGQTEQKLAALQDDLQAALDRLAAERDVAPVAGENPRLREWLEGALAALAEREREALADGKARLTAGDDDDARHSVGGG